MADAVKRTNTESQESCACAGGTQTLERVADHEQNRTDWDQPYSSQGYQVWRCRNCGQLWGCRYQWDAGTGHDDRWERIAGMTPDKNSTEDRYYEQY